MKVVKEALIQWGEAMHLSMENCTVFYSPVLDHWRVNKWAVKVRQVLSMMAAVLARRLNICLALAQPNNGVQPRLPAAQQTK